MTLTTLFTGTTPMDNTTASVAAAAVSSPVWLPWLQHASETAAMFAPILGAVWLIVQIAAKVKEMRNRDRDK